MELEQEIQQAEKCKEFKTFIDKWAIDRKKELINSLCNTTNVNDILAIRGEIKGILSVQSLLDSKIDNAKVAKSLLKELI